MSDYKASLQHMRNVLGSRQFDRTGAKTSKIVDSNEDDEKHKSFNLLENKDLLNIVTKYTPSKNALLSMTSKTVKENLEKEDHQITTKRHMKAQTLSSISALTFLCTLPLRVCLNLCTLQDLLEQLNL